MGEEYSLDDLVKKVTLDSHYKIGTIDYGTENSCASLFQEWLEGSSLEFVRNHHNDILSYCFKISSEISGDQNIVCYFLGDSDVRIVCTFISNKQCIKSYELLECINEYNDINVYSRLIYSKNSIMACYSLSFDEYFYSDMVVKGVFRVSEEIDRAYVDLMRIIYS